MSKTVNERVMSTRAARAKLADGKHWRSIDADVHLGYRKSKRVGRWVVRWYVGDQKYQQETIGSADDAVEANGVDCFTFEQAKARASALVAERRAEALAALDGPAPTVATAVESYMQMRDARFRAQSGSEGKSDARRRMTRHVLNNRKLAEAKLHALKEKDLAEWREGLGSSLAQSSVRRTANDFKAALNAAATRNRTKLPAEIFIIIKNGLAAGEDSPPVARDKQALPDVDVRKIIDAAKAIDAEQEWDGDLFRMVAVLAATGARFSQVRRMAVADVQADNGRLMVPSSRKGRGTKTTTHVSVRVGDDIIDALRPAITGRRASEVALERWRHKQVVGSNSLQLVWVRDRRAGWSAASELSRPWRLIIERAGVPSDVIPYALRHSSIVRQLRAGLPVRLVAALHDTSSAMIEKHYAAAIVDALDGLAAAAVIPLIPEHDVGENVVKLRAGQ